jgi:hypothetical protein
MTFFFSNFQHSLFPPFLFPFYQISAYGAQFREEQSFLILIFKIPTFNLPLAPFHVAGVPHQLPTMNRLLSQLRHGSRSSLRSAYHTRPCSRCGHLSQFVLPPQPLRRAGRPQRTPCTGGAQGGPTCHTRLSSLLL